MLLRFGRAAQGAGRREWGIDYPFRILTTMVIYAMMVIMSGHEETEEPVYVQVPAMQSRMDEADRGSASALPELQTATLGHSGEKVIPARAGSRNLPTDQVLTTGVKHCNGCSRDRDKKHFRVIYDTKTFRYRLYAYCRDCALAKDRIRCFKSHRSFTGGGGYTPGEKSRARALVNSAIRRGKLEKQVCSLCGAKAQAHHRDYSKPFEIEWLCQVHHGQRHWKPIDTPLLMAAEYESHSTAIRRAIDATAAIRARGENRHE